jgi:AcrR family transcriptional regulator
MTAQPLTTIQAQIVKSFASGATLTAAAAAAGVHRSTIYEWLQTHHEFAAAVRQARAAYRSALNDQICELTGLAFTALRSLLEDPYTPPAIRTKIALNILNHSQPSTFDDGQSDISDTSGAGTAPPPLLAVPEIKKGKKTPPQAAKIRNFRHIRHENFRPTTRTWSCIRSIAASTSPGRARTRISPVKLTHRTVPVESTRNSAGRAISCPFSPAFGCNTPYFRITSAFGSDKNGNV